MTHLALNVYKFFSRRLRLNNHYVISSFSTDSTYPIKDLTVSQNERTKDTILNELKNVTSQKELFDIISTHNKSLGHRHVITALESLFVIAKSETSEKSFSRIISHPSFEKLCSGLKKYSRVMNMYEIIGALKVLAFLGVSGNSTVCQYLMQLIRQDINNLNLQQVMFLDFVLRKTDPSHLGDVLQLALPLVFQIQLGVQMDHENVPHLAELLHYSARNNIPLKYMNSIMTCLILQMKDINASTADKIVNCLLKMDIAWKDSGTNFKTLYSHCMKVLSDNIYDLHYNDILRILNLMKSHIVQKRELIYHEGFLNSCGNYAIEKNIGFEKSIQICSLLSRHTHTHLEILEYICELLILDKTILPSSHSFNIFQFISSLSNANYKSQYWDEIKIQLLESTIYKKRKIQLPWIKFAVELASLGCYHDEILNKIFHENFLDAFLSRENNDLDHIQLLNVYQAVVAFHPSYDGNFPPINVLNKAIALNMARNIDGILKTALEIALSGSQYVASGVKMPNGQFVDFVVALDDNNSPIAFPIITTEDDYVDYEDLDIKNNMNVYCIMNFSKNNYSINANILQGKFHLLMQILENMGYNAISICTDDWLKLNSTERIPYLRRELNLNTSLYKEIDSI